MDWIPGVYIDLSQWILNYDVTATSMAGTVVMVDGAEGVFGTSQGDSITRRCWS